MNIKTNLFDDNESYAKDNYWVDFNGDTDKYFFFKTLCQEEKAELDAAETKKARVAHNDERIVFKKYIPKNRLLFVLYLMKLWPLETK